MTVWSALLLAGLCSVALLWIGGLAWAGEPAAKSEKPAAKRRREPAAKSGKPAAKSGKQAAKGTEESDTTASATYTVKKGPLKITVDLEGVFEAQTAHEIVVKPEEWNALTVESAVAARRRGPQGRRAADLGDRETRPRHRRPPHRAEALRVAIQQSEDQLRALEKITPLDLEASRRAARVAEEDRKYFFDVERPFAVKATEFSLKVAKETLEYEEEELRQLEKMYKADDITEETEQIVLKRARDTVEKAKFMVEYAKSITTRR